LIEIGRTGRKGKYEEWLTVDGLTRLTGWARDGLTDDQIAANIGVSRGTLYAWYNRFADILNAVKKGKEPVDVQVENALLKRALGYDYEEITTETEEFANGNTRTHVRRVTKHVPGDTTAQIFWLKNRKPKQWREKAESTVNIDTEDLSPLVELLKDE
jgi:hypothetical protein